MSPVPIVGGLAETVPRGQRVDGRILDLATQFVRLNGPARTTIVAVAEAAGMSHANVYRYFKSKADLVDAISAAWLRQIEADVRVIVEGPDPAHDKLERLLLAIHRGYRDKLERDPRIFGLLVAATMEKRAFARKHRQRLQSEVRTVLDEGITQGGLAGADSGPALALVFDMMHRFIHPSAIALDAETARSSLDRRAGRVLRLLLRALARGRLRD